MALVEGQFGAVQLGPQKTGLDAVRVVGVRLPGRHAVVFIVVVVVFQIGETQASHVLTVDIVGTGATASGSSARRARHHDQEHSR